MGQFKDYLRVCRTEIDSLRLMLRSVEIAQITPAELLRRSQDPLRRMFALEHVAESMRADFIAGFKSRLPPQYHHALNCRTGAEMFILEAAVYGVGCDLFADLKDKDELQLHLSKGNGNLDRARDFLKELKWYRRWSSTPAASGTQIIAVEDLLNMLRAVREGLLENKVLLETFNADDMDADIETANEIVRASVMAIHNSPNGIVAGLSRSRLQSELNHLKKMILDMARFPSSWHVLGAMERVTISQAVLWWSLAIKAKSSGESVGGQNMLTRAAQWFGESNHYRNRRRRLWFWYPFKYLLGTYQPHEEPEWAAVLPTKPELKAIRARL